MEILLSIAIGAAIGRLATLMQRSSTGGAGGVAIGILGALLGAAAETWLGGMGERTLMHGVLAAAIGGALLAMLWVIARRLFLNPPTGPIQRT